MAARGIEPVPVDGEDRDWYFDEDGTLAPTRPASQAPRLLEWLGLVYAVVVLMLDSPTWSGRRAEREVESQAPMKAKALA